LKIKRVTGLRRINVNKKGVETIRAILYTLAGLVIGGLLIAVMVISIPKLMMGSVEQVMSKDMALSIMTISSSPYDVVFNYEENMEHYKVQITQNEVKINSKDGFGRYSYFPMKGVTVTDATIDGAVSVPIILKTNVLSFSDENNDFSDDCAQLQQTYNTHDAQLGIRFVARQDSTPDANNYLNILSIALNSKAKYNPNIKVAYVDPNDETMDGGHPLIVMLGVSRDKTAKITYYEDSQSPLKTSWSHRIACYMGRALKTKYPGEFNEIKFETTSEQRIIIDFGDASRYVDLSKNNGFTTSVSTEIFDAINTGLTD
jgi:hypothetical protein